MSRTLKITDLPPRAYPLDDADLSDVLGGCNTSGTRCEDDKDCCGSSTCSVEQRHWVTTNYPDQPGASSQSWETYTYCS